MSSSKSRLAFDLSSMMLGDRWAREEVMRQSGLSAEQCQAVLDNQLAALDELTLIEALERCEGVTSVL